MIKFCLKSVGLLLVSSFLLSSCGKKGCTDSNATSFSAAAKKDDGTCRYEGSTIFWIRDSTAQNMAADTIKSLTVYVDGKLIGSISTSASFASQPSCGSQGAVTVTKDLFSAPNKALSYRILDDKGVKRRAGTTTFYGNTCQSFEILYFP